MMGWLLLFHTLTDIVDVVGNVALYLWPVKPVSSEVYNMFHSKMNDIVMKLFVNKFLQLRWYDQL